MNFVVQCHQQKRQPRLLVSSVHSSRPRIRHVALQQNTFIGHLFRSLGSIEVRCVTNDADVEIWEALEEAEAEWRSSEWGDEDKC